MRLAAAALVAPVLLAGCVETAAPGLSPALESDRFAGLRGWAAEDHAAALSAYQAGCPVAREFAAREVCARARTLGRVERTAARAFFEANFRPEPVAKPGVLTGYFAPDYQARASPDAEFSAPLRPKPSGPASWKVDRAGIEAAPAPDALAWLRPEDLFFLQVQGSGGLSFSDGSRQKAVYAADNALPFVAIARPMVQRGLVPPDQASGSSIHAWLAAHRGPEAKAIMQENPRYVFFRLEPDDGLDPRGAAGVRLIGGRSLAIDPTQHGYGELLWLDASDPVLAGAPEAYRRVALALDTGSAIQGVGRADLYLGRGQAAGLEAGRVRHTLHLVRLVPIGSAATGTPRDETAAASGRN